MAITTLPAPPLRSDGPATFADKGDAFMAALPAFAIEANALGAQVTADAAAVAAAAPGAVAAANFKGEYAGGTTYQIGQSASYGGDTWFAKTVNTGVTPVAGAAWQRVVAIPSQTGQTGKVLTTDGDVPSWTLVRSIGDTITTSRELAAPEWLKCDGSVYLQSSYTTLFASLGLISATPADGVTWSSLTLPDPVSYVDSMAFGAGLFVRLHPSSGACYTSPDGSTWTSRSLPVGTWSVVRFVNNLFVAFQASTTATYATSPDGITWTSRTMPVAAVWGSIAFGAGLFVAVASSVSSSATAVYATSTDAVTWTQRAMPSASFRSCTVFGNGLFVTMAANVGIHSSPDGITWTAVSAGVQPGHLAFGGGVFLLLPYFSGAAFASIRRSTDTLTWTTKNLVSNSYWSNISWVNGLFVALSSHNGDGTTRIDTARISYDLGLTWVQRVLGVLAPWGSCVYGNNVLIAYPILGFNTVAKNGAPYPFNALTQFAVPTIATTFNLKTYIKAA